MEGMAPTLALWMPRDMPGWQSWIKAREPAPGTCRMVLEQPAFILPCLGWRVSDVFFFFLPELADVAAIVWQGRSTIQFTLSKSAWSRC